MSEKTNIENVEVTEETVIKNDVEVTDKEELTDVKEENVEVTEEPATENNDNFVNDNSNIELKEEYIVVYPFLDLIDDSYEYKLNKIYPRENISDEQRKIALSEERISQLTTSNNRIGKILISKIEN